MHSGSDEASLAWAQGREPRARLDSAGTHPALCLDAGYGTQVFHLLSNWLELTHISLVLEEQDRGQWV